MSVPSCSPECRSDGGPGAGADGPAGTVVGGVAVGARWAVPGIAPPVDGAGCVVDGIAGGVVVVVGAAGVEVTGDVEAGGLAEPAGGDDVVAAGCAGEAREA